MKKFLVWHGPKKSIEGGLFTKPTTRVVVEYKYAAACASVGRLISVSATEKGGETLLRNEGRRIRPTIPERAGAFFVCLVR